MLETLHIQNFAIIDEIEVEFRTGLNVLTGETGAGKSIIVGALELVLGGRASSDIVRDNVARAKVDAVFRIPRPSRHLKSLLDGLDIELTDGELVLTRIIAADGRSRAHVCGNIVPVSMLAQIGDELVDLHGQHDHQSLLRADRQLELLDNYANTEVDAAVLAELVGKLRDIEKQIAELETDDRERARRVEFLRFEVAEIKGADLKSNEEDEVKSRRNIITNAEKIYELTCGAYAHLYEGEGDAAIDCMDHALRALEELARIDARFQSFVTNLGEVRASLADLCSELRGYTGQVEYDPQELETLNQRISQIGDLKRKFGDSIEAILAYRDNAIDEIERFEQRDKHLAEMQSRRDEFHREATEAAGVLSEKRRSAAARLDKKVTAALQELGMKGGKFETSFESTELAARGIDRADFMLAANPGERPKLLKQVASGGEISRVMLAIKTVFASADRIPTLVFDEIDAGVGGAVANKVAQRLRELAESHQTLCITHLPQIAAAAHTHYYVSKTTVKGRTTTTVSPVENNARIEELARLLDGSVSDVSMKHASAMLESHGA